MENAQKQTVIAMMLFQTSAVSFSRIQGEEAGLLKKEFYSYLKSEGNGKLFAAWNVYSGDREADNRAKTEIYELYANLRMQGNSKEDACELAGRFLGQRYAERMPFVRCCVTALMEPS